MPQSSQTTKRPQSQQPATELLILHFEEIRRRSKLLWEAVPTELYGWRPDRTAMTLLEMVRHVLESEHLYHVIMIGQGDDIRHYLSPWNKRPYKELKEELDFAQPFRGNFLLSLCSIEAAELETMVIDRLDNGQSCPLGKYLLKMAYHEAVHAGQLLSYLRSLNIDRPRIWD